MPDAEPIDNIIFASLRPLQPADHDGRCSLSPGARRFSYGMSNLERPRPDRAGFVVTDDYNPLDSMQTAKSEACRDMLVSRLGAEILAR
jgi:hypothetical protein